MANLAFLSLNLLMHQKSEVIVKRCWIAPYYALLNSQSHFVLVFDL
jgi:hypothetical protein